MPLWFYSDISLETTMIPSIYLFFFILFIFNFIILLFRLSSFIQKISFKSVGSADVPRSAHMFYCFPNKVSLSRKGRANNQSLFNKIFTHLIFVFCKPIFITKLPKLLAINFFSYTIFTYTLYFSIVLVTFKI